MAACFCKRAAVSNQEQLRFYLDEQPASQDLLDELYELPASVFNNVSEGTHSIRVTGPIHVTRLTLPACQDCLFQGDKISLSTCGYVLVEFGCIFAV